MSDGFGFLPDIREKRTNFNRRIGKIWNSISDIYDQLNTEVKVHDVSHGEYNPSTTPQFIELTDIDLGITGTSSAIDTGYRIGNSIKLLSIQVKGHLRANSANANMQQVRVQLIKHYDNFLGDAMDYNKLYDVNTRESNVDFLNSFRNLDNTRQYKVLATRVMELTTSTADKNNQHVFNIFKSYKGKRSGNYVKWEGGNGEDPSNGKYYLMIQSNQTTNLPKLDFSTRLKYVDN